ncbi:MAG: SH3-like domain-containing protein [Desulfuromonadales bacterium]|nr:SH3-like domain-containing protein [Desulfuromonadales bacterium]
MIKIICLTLAALLAWPLACLAEPARVSKADSLYEKPFADAKVLAKLAAGQQVDVQKREGSWYQVKAAGKTGWMRMLSVRRTAAAAAVSAGSLSQVATGRAGTGKIIATTGVRGLGEETLKPAAFSEEAIAAAERFRVSQAEAERLARDAGLSPRNVPPLPASVAAGPGEMP